MTGTAVGNALYARGGWIESEAVNIGFVATSLLMCILRGPHEKGWVGWHGGWNMKLKHEREAVKRDADPEESQEQVKTVAEQEKR